MCLLLMWIGVLGREGLYGDYGGWISRDSYIGMTRRHERERNNDVINGTQDLYNEPGTCSRHPERLKTGDCHGSSTLRLRPFSCECPIALEQARDALPLRQEPFSRFVYTCSNRIASYHPDSCRKISPTHILTRQLDVDINTTSRQACQRNPILYPNLEPHTPFFASNPPFPLRFHPTNTPPSTH